MARKVFAILLVFVLIFSFTLTGCQKRKAEKGGTFTFRLFFEPTSLDPAAMSNDIDTAQIVSQVFDGLLDYGADGKVVPAVAERWEMNDKADEFTFFLKKGIKFSNGREVKASDFKYAWDRVADPKVASQLSYHMAPIQGFDEFQSGKAKELSGVEAVNDTTLKVKLSKPNADFLTIVAHLAFSPVPKEEVEKDEKAFGQKPVGNGPFKVKKWTTGKEVETVKNSGYYGEEANLNNVTYKPIEDDNTALKEFRAGGLSYTTVPAGQLEQLKKDSSLKIYIAPVLEVYYYGFDMSKKPWDKKDVRLALNYAVDRNKILEKYSQNADNIAYGLIPKGMPGFQPNVTDFSYNPEKAKQLLEKAGYPEGRGFPKQKLIFNEGVGHDIVAQIVQQNLKDIGINIEIQGLEGGAWQDQIMSQKASFYRMAWGADYPIMDSFLSALFGTETASTPTGYSNKTFDAKISEAQAETDEAQRIKLYQEAEKMLMADAPVIPLLNRTNKVVIDKKVKDFKYDLLGFVDMKKVWKEK